MKFKSNDFVHAQSLNPTQVYLEGGDYVKVAGAAAADLYAYGHTNVLFKPTKAS